ncbi:MAG: class I SAM-dependent methyltransferase [Rhodospirillaceae bacterium]|nr:class I SAM-dependent methyltransferase [Rhodospirillaceae bacterium]
MRTSYDTIGVNYSDLRKPDSRIEMVIGRALGTAKTVLNVGAGTGSYEPTDRIVTAVEPSIEMIRQRSALAAPVIQGYAENLPFDDNSFDASMAILTVHHWADKEKGLKEMRRVTRGRVVILTFDPLHRGYWLADYIPELVKLDEAQMPSMTDYEEWLGPVEITPVPIPHDCTDGFLGAYWRRPAAYLDPKIRTAHSCFWAVDNVSTPLKKLARDLNSGAWAQRYSELLDLDEYDFGYRLVTTKY